MIFVAGLPRSGSTLLMNILGQNPKFHVTPTSGLLPTLIQIRNNWWSNTLHNTIEPEIAKLKLKSVLNGIIKNYHPEAKEGSVIFDKNRAWPNHFETLEWVLDQKVKMIITVRDINEILASFEKLWRENKKYRQIPQEQQGNFSNIKERSATWLLPNQPLGFAMNTIQDAKLRGFRDQMFQVNYNELVEYPEAVIASIYVWLKLPFFKHDFENIKQITRERDEFHGIEGLHTIRPKIEQNTSWKDILGDIIC